ncbi:MAG: VWA domain-containing protein [Acidobacteria bacterium]|nr:VWA domain-containing protein [Acidobacteriota bacterium]
MVGRALSLFVLAACGIAQAQVSDEPLIKITVGLVQVDAVVTDKQGNPVRDLAAEDFRILQDGEARAITNLSWVETESGPHAKTPGNRAPRDAHIDRSRVRRTIAVVADDLGMSIQGIHNVRRDLRSLIDGGLGEDDLMAIMRTSAGTSFASGFTSDRRRLHAALDDLWWRPGASMGGLAGIDLPDGSAAAALLRSDPGNPALQRGTVVESPDFDLSSRVLAGSMGALQQTIRAMRELPGRKAVLFFSESAYLVDPRNAVEGLMDISRGQMRLGVYRTLVDDANRAGVVLYGIDPSGVGGGVELHPVGSSWNQDGGRAPSSSFGPAQAGLAYLARQTGGLFLSNSNDIAALAEAALADMSGYYLLGYRPDSETFDRQFHDIQVEVTRPGLRVRSRKGFLGLEDKDRTPPPPRTRQEQLLTALRSPFGADGLELRTTALFALDPDGKPSIQSMTRIDANGLTFTALEDGLLGIELDIVTAAFDISGQPVEAIDQIFTARVRPDNLEAVKRRGLLYTTRQPLKKPGAYQFRLVVRDTASQIVGSASQFVQTPPFDKKGRLGMSGLVAGSATQLGQEGEPTTLEGNPALRIFRPGERIYYWRQILNPEIEKSTGKPDLATRSRLYRDGELVLESDPFPFQPTQLVSKRLVEDVRLYDLPAELVPGRYILEVETIDRLRDADRGRASDWIDFQVR